METIYNSSVKDGKVTFSFNGKEVTRSIKKIGSLQTIKFNNNLCYLQPSSDWNYGPSIVAFDQDAKEFMKSIQSKPKNWFMYESILDQIVSEHSKNNVADGSSNGIVYSSIYKGNIEKCSKEQYGRNNYSSGQYFHKGLKIGSNHPDRGIIHQKAFIVSSLFSGFCGYSNSDSKATISKVYGTAFTAIGLG